MLLLYDARRVPGTGPYVKNLLVKAPVNNIGRRFYHPKQLLFKESPRVLCAKDATVPHSARYRNSYAHVEKSRFIIRYLAASWPVAQLCFSPAESSAEETVEQFERTRLRVYRVPTG